MSDETMDQLLADLAAEQQRSADLAAMVSEWDARCRLMAQAIADRNVGLLQTMAADLLSPDTRETVRAIQTQHGTNFTGWPVQVLTMGFIEYLDDLPAPNHVVIDMIAPPKDGHPARRLSVTAQWADGQTPQQRIGELIAETERLRREHAHKAEEWEESATIERKRADDAEADRDAWRDALRACYTGASADPETTGDAEVTGAYVTECIHQLRDGRADIALRLSSLLAVIHRDGGHYEAEHGTEKACEDAEALVVARLDAETRAAAAEAIVAAAVKYLAAEDAGDGGQAEDDYSDAVRLVDARNALVALLPKETR